MPSVEHQNITIQDEEKSPPRVHDPESIAINAAGYKDQLTRQYSLLGIVGTALTVDNAWAALGSSISVSIRESGPIYYGSA